MYTDSAAEFMIFYQLIMNYLSIIKLHNLLGIIVVLQSIAFAISYCLHRQSKKQQTTRVIKNSDMLSLEEKVMLITHANVEQIS